MQLPPRPFQHRQNLSAQIVHCQRQLPSLQDIVKPEADAHVDKKQKFEDDWSCQTTFVDCGSTSTTPTATSPVQAICRSMPALDGLPFRTYNDDMLQTPGGWGSTSQYSNGSPSYASSNSSSQGYYSQSRMANGRSQQNLPSLSDMNLAQGTPAYNSRPSHMSRPHHSSAPYFCTSPMDPVDLSYAKTSQAAYSSSMYNQAPRTPYTISAGDYGQPMYDNYSCYPNGTSWPPSMPLPGSGGYVGSDASSIGSTRRRRGNLPKHVTDILRQWFNDHLDHPYPSDDDKQMLIVKTNLSQQQISNWFINARRRHWPAMKQQREQMLKIPAGRHGPSSTGHC